MHHPMARNQNHLFEHVRGLIKHESFLVPNFDSIRSWRHGWCAWETDWFCVSDLQGGWQGTWSSLGRCCSTARRGGWIMASWWASATSRHACRWIINPSRVSYQTWQSHHDRHAPKQITSYYLLYICACSFYFYFCCCFSFIHRLIDMHISIRSEFKLLRAF